MSLTRLQKLALKRAASLANEKVTQLRSVVRNNALFAMSRLNTIESRPYSPLDKNVDSTADCCVNELARRGSTENQMVRELEELQEILNAVLSEL